jgi:hypothetical protein
MSLLNSKFDIVSVDNAVSLASLAQVLTTGTMSLNTNGTPVAGTIQPGMLVMMNSSGTAVLAQSPTKNPFTAGGADGNPVLIFVTVDGDVDYSGAFVKKITCLHGGVTIKTDQYNAGAYVPGAPVVANAGKFDLATADEVKQIVGFVGPNGLDATNGVLEVILPQGAGI